MSNILEKVKEGVWPLYWMVIGKTKESLEMRVDDVWEAILWFLCFVTLVLEVVILTPFAILFWLTADTIDGVTSSWKAARSTGWIVLAFWIYANTDDMRAYLRTVFRPKVENMEGVFQTPTVEPATLESEDLNRLARIFEEYDALYKEDPEIRRLANGIRDTLGIDGRALYAAIDFKESRGNGYAVGDLDHLYKAYGRWQTRSPAVQDLRQAYNWDIEIEDFVGNDSEQLRNAIQAFHRYIILYRKPGEEDDLNAWLNTWNGGPSGTPKSTEYTREVRRILRNIQG